MSQAQSSESPPPTIASRIKYWREKAGLRGFELADRCGVSPAAVSRWEHGSTEPTHENLARIAEACGTDLSKFWAAP